MHIVIQVSAAMSMKSVPSWDFTRCRMVVCYRRFGATYLSHLLGYCSSRTSGLLHCWRRER